MLKQLMETAEGFVVLFIGVLVVFCGYNLYSLAVGTVSWEYFIGWLAVFVLVGGGWLTARGYGFIGKMFMVVAVITIIGITVSHKAPGVATYIATASAEANRKALLAAADVSEGHEFQCDRTTPDIKLFAYDPVEKKEKSIAWTLRINGRFVCFNRPGVNHLTGEVRVQVDGELAKRIREQEPLSPPPTTSPPPQPFRTPVLELGDRPVPTPIPEIGDRPVP